MILSKDQVIKVLFTSLQNEDENYDTREVVNRLPAYEQAMYYGKIKSLNRLQFLGGRLLARRLYSDLTQEEDDCKLEIGPFGKPFLSGKPHWGVSITHSGEIAACAMSTLGPIGIDVEAIRPVNLPIFEPFFLHHEWDFLQQQTNHSSVFFSLWTRKEAVAKADGRGLGIGLQGIDSQSGNISYRAKNWIILPLELGDGYAAALAYTPNKHAFTIHMQKITMIELLRHYSRSTNKIHEH